MTRLLGGGLSYMPRLHTEALLSRLCFGAGDLQQRNRDKRLGEEGAAQMSQMSAMYEHERLCALAATMFLY